ncbi:MAG: hypothetical protein DYG98_15920 [Haliscomenobacteraceae bacterium CHB4]|nr:hypothetical protein [Haliscomenobacteraceae bacterium CHB4]
MFKPFVFRSLFAVAFTLANAAVNALPAPAFYQLVNLTAGTVVNVTLNESIDAESVSVGNSLDLMVRANVTVNGKVLIAAGATATGWVKSVKKGCDGKCSEITITVENAMAVDGQMVNLRSIPHVVKAPCCKGTAKADIGANLSARVLNDIKINA